MKINANAYFAGQLVSAALIVIFVIVIRGC